MQFRVTKDELKALMQQKSTEKLQQLGGVEGIASALNSDLTRGLLFDNASAGVQVDTADNSVIDASTLHLNTAPSDFEQRKKEFGVCNQTILPRNKLWKYVVYAAQDRSLMVLLVAVIIKLNIGIYKTVSSDNTLALANGIAILIASTSVLCLCQVALVVMVVALTNYSRNNQFRALSAQSESLQCFRAMRNGTLFRIPKSDAMVGDVVLVEAGDVVPADGIIISSFGLQVDESSFSGVSEAVKKSLEKDPFLFMGTKVNSGMATALVVAVGENTTHGRELSAVSGLTLEETPLQSRLNQLSKKISRFGIITAVLLFLVLTVVYFALVPFSKRSFIDIADDFFNIFIIAITLVVVAEPESLPLAVAIALSHSSQKLLENNNLVRHLNACETMGNATSICCDKTGTLTMNTMAVVKGMLFDVPFYENSACGPGIILEKNVGLVKLPLLAASININCSAREITDASGKKSFSGCMTEVALLEFTRRLGYDYQIDRNKSQIISLEPFTSETKRMVTVSQGEDGDRQMLVKGAFEVIIGLCDFFMNEIGDIIELKEDKRLEIRERVNLLSQDSLRPLAIAFKELKDDDMIPPKVSRLVLISVVGIQDPIRTDVPEAVAKCQQAGVAVRMLTGDNQETARFIAKKCGILSNDGVVMEGPEFRRLSEKERLKIVPRIQVLARSTPEDKKLLVESLIANNETVAVTGDGTNDAPALKAADVGFSMGIAGTEVAKEASDIVLMDDNFASLVKAVVWGRSVYDSVRKFLQFQLAINLSAVVITFLTSLISIIASEDHVPSPILDPLQLLWANLIMNTFAALALATGAPASSALSSPPENRTDPLVTKNMWYQIASQAMYQILVCMAFYFVGDRVRIPQDDKEFVSKYSATMIFNIFVQCQIFNEINSRSLDSQVSILDGLHRSWNFVVIWTGTVVAQIMIVQYGHSIFKLQPGGLDAVSWIICIGLGCGSMVVGLIVRFLTKKESQTIMHGLSRSESSYGTLFSVKPGQP